jgi:uncharacterized protein YjiS (DUF1127 family)
MIPDTCFSGDNREIFSVKGESLAAFREFARLSEKYKKWMSSQRSTRNLQL